MILPNYSRLFALALSLALLTLVACNQSSTGSDVANGKVVNQICQKALSQQEPFFEEVSTATSASSSEEVPYLRNRFVKVNMNSLKNAIRGSVQKQIKLDLFNDTSFDVLIEKAEQVSENNFVVTGRMADDSSSVALVLNDDVLVANIHPHDGHRYSIRYLGDGTHTIQEFEDNDTNEDCLAVESPDPVDSSNLSQELAMASTPIIDMLVAYTPAAKTKAGGDTAIKALIQMGIADTNKAFADSGVNLKARLVGTMQVKTNDTNNFSSDLTALRSKTDGRWDEVHAERSRLGADQVTLVGVYPNNSVAGIGYIKAGSTSAFTIVKTSAFGQYSFTHELGHNIGLQHSDGFVNSAGGFRTIMAYGSVVRIARFSNPNILYRNYLTGDSDQNSARILNANGSFTASLFPMKVAISNDEIPATPPSESCP